MSGHSKWSKVKHQKATTDVVKSAAFTKAAHAITIAVKEGGGVTDPANNFHLRLAMEKARAVNMPKENIIRAVSRASGEEGSNLEQILYEGYGPGGVGLLIRAVTDNKMRTVALIKNILDRAGGRISSPGSVSFQFVRQGIDYVLKPEMKIPFDQDIKQKIESVKNDLEALEDVQTVYTSVT